MQLWDKLAEYAKNFSSYRTTMDFGDVAEILIIAVLLYYTLVWMKTTRAWILLKGLIVILAFLLLAYFFPDDNDTVDGAECAGVCGDGIDRGAAA